MQDDCENPAVNFGRTHLQARRAKLEDENLGHRSDDAALPGINREKHGESTALTCTHRLFALTAIEIRCVEPRKAPVAVEVS
jgi:hypothetical protein